MKKVKVCLIGIFYPLAMLRYFERALERREDVELVSLGPYTGSWIPWNGGMNLLPKYDKPPTHILPREFIIRGQADPYILIAMYKDLQDIDLWLEVDAGFYLNPRPKNGIIAHVATDPHALNYDQQRVLSDYFFNMQKHYSKSKDIYLPYAYDPTVFYPEDLKKIYDACLIGLHYQQRTNLVNRLISRNLRVNYSIGDIYDEFRTKYNQSKIALNWSSLLDLNARTFEAMGMALPLVTNRVPDLPTFCVEGDHYLGFNDVDEAVSQVMKLLEDEDMAIEMGLAAYRKVKAGHTWDHRITQILEMVGLK